MPLITDWIHGDSFELYTTLSQRFAFTAGLISLAATGGPTNGGVLGIFDGGQAQYNLASGQTTISTGFHIWTSTPVASAISRFFVLENAPGSIFATLSLNNFGGFTLTSPTGTSASSPNLLWRQKSWFHIQIHCTTTPGVPSGISCTIDVYFNGVKVINGFIGGSTSGAGNIGATAFIWNQGGMTINYANWWMTQGSLLGDSTVKHISPTGAGILTQWTPSSGTNWQVAAQIPPGPQNVSANQGSGNIDLYAFAALTFPSGATIWGVQQNVFILANASNDQPFDFATYIAAGPSTYLNSDTAPHIGIAFVSLFLGANPHTGAAWGLTDIGGSASQFGQEAT